MWCLPSPVPAARNGGSHRVARCPMVQCARRTGAPRPASGDGDPWHLLQLCSIACACADHQADSVIETRSLSHVYAGGPSLNFPDVVVPQGVTLLLRGASGSGKSTWLAVAAGLLSPAAGEIVVAGQSVAALKAGER